MPQTVCAYLFRGVPLMKRMLSFSLTTIALLVLLSGCPWFKPPVPPVDPVEGEEVVEGELPAEGESPEEGEAPLFTSADPAQRGIYNETLDGTPTPDAGEENEGGKESRELVEPDVIRRAGNLLYILNQHRGLIIADLDGQRTLSQTPTFGYPRDLYLVGNKAYVLVSYAQDVRLDEKGRYQVSYGSRLYVFDVTDPEAVVSLGSSRFEGDLIDSRLVGSILYAVCSNYTWYYPEDTDDAIETASVEKSYGDTWAISLDTAQPGAISQVAKVKFQGYGNLIQATSEAIFCATSDWYSDSTAITYIDISDPRGAIAVRGTAVVPGRLADRFKMDAWNDVLRVVSNTGWADRKTLITTWDLKNPDTFAQLGSTELESAAGDTTYATRFDGARAYIVTYLTVDPLYVVDLSDPANPQVLGELKIPGWSTHIEPRGDRLIALGVDDEGGGRRVMVSLFDVSDPGAPQRLDYTSFGDNWSWSTAYEDVKAFTVLDNAILVPFSGWNYGSGGYDRLQFISYNRDRLQAQGYVDLRGSALRALQYGGYHFAVTQEQLAVIDASDPNTPRITNSITLAENIADVVPLKDGWALEIICRYDSADSSVRAVNAAGETGQEVLLKTSSITESFLWNDTAVLVAAGYDYYPEYNSFYRVYLVNVSDPLSPVLEKEILVKLQPWYYGWWMGYDMVASGKQARPGYYPYYYYDPSPTAFLAGDYLVMRGSGDRFDRYLGASSAYQGLAVLNLNDPDNMTYLGLGDPAPERVSGDGKQIYLTYRKTLATSSGNAYRCAFYLSTLDPATLDESARVNVPGIFQHRVPGTDILLLKDTQYLRDGNLKELLRSGILSENKFSLQDSVNLPSYGTQLALSDNFAGYVGYIYSENSDVPRDTLLSSGNDKAAEEARGYMLGGIFVNAKGGFKSHERKNVGDVWCNLLGVRKGSVFLSVSGAAASQWNFNEHPPEHVTLFPVMGYPSKLRVGKDTAYLPLGYGGLASFPL